MRHKWDEGEMYMGKIYSTCSVCGGVRSRERVAGVDYINGPGISIDMTGSTRKGWRYEDTPRSCPAQDKESEAS